MIPSEVKASIEAIQPVGLDAQDVAILKAIREAVPRCRPDEPRAGAAARPGCRSGVRVQGYLGSAETFEGLKIKPKKAPPATI